MINEIFNTVIQFIAENFGDAVALTIGNGITYNFAIPLFAMVIFIYKSLGMM